MYFKKHTGETGVSRMNGKGSRQRPVDKTKFDSNWDLIFKNKQEKKDGIISEKTTTEKTATPEQPQR
jgi:hypothetical protein